MDAQTRLPKTSRSDREALHRSAAAALERAEVGGSFGLYLRSFDETYETKFVVGGATIVSDDDAELYWLLVDEGVMSAFADSCPSLVGRTSTMRLSEVEEYLVDSPIPFVTIADPREVVRGITHRVPQINVGPGGWKSIVAMSIAKAAVIVYNAESVSRGVRWELEMIFARGRDDDVILVDHTAADDVILSALHPDMSRAWKRVRPGVRDYPLAGRFTPLPLAAFEDGSWRESLKFITRQSRESLEAGARLTASAAEAESSDIPLAINLLGAAVDVFTAARFRSSAAEAARRRAVLGVQIGRFREALDWLQPALEFVEPLPNLIAETDQAGLQLLRARAAIGAGATTTANDALNHALDLLGRCPDTTRVWTALKSLDEMDVSLPGGPHLRDRSQALRVEALFDFGHQRGCTSRDLRQLIDAKMGEPTAEWTDGLKLRYAAACLEQNDRSNFDRYVNWALFSMEAMPPGPRRENLVRMVVRLALGGGQLSMSFDQWFLIDQLIARADSSSRQLVELPDPKLSQGGLSLREWLFALHIAKKDFGVDHANVLFDHLGPAMVARLQGRSGLGALVRAAVTKRPNR